MKLRATWEAGAKIGRQVSHDLDHYMLIKIIFRLLFWIRWRLLLLVTSASWWSMLMRFVLETMRTMRRTSMTCSRVGLTAVWQRGPLQVRIHRKQRKTCPQRRVCGWEVPRSRVSHVGKRAHLHRCKRKSSWIVNCHNRLLWQSKTIFAWIFMIPTCVSDVGIVHIKKCILWQCHNHEN